MAKLARESRLRERRMIKQAKKDGRRAAAADHQGALADAPHHLIDQAGPMAPAQPAVQDAAMASVDA